MKSILLASASVVAFAGAAAADGHANIGFAGEATLGYNDDVEDGFYWSADLDVTASAELDNGLTATATFGLNVVSDDLGQSVSTSDYVLSLSSDTASLSFGDLDPVAEDRWSGVDGSDAESWNDQDVHFAVGFDAILVGEVTFGGTTAAISYGVALDDGNDVTGEQLDAMQLHVTSSFGAIDVELAYQDEFAADAVFGVAAGGSFAGADVTVAYVDDGSNNSLGASVSYPVGPVTVGAYYTMNDTTEDNYGISADYVSGPLSISASYDVDGDGDAGDSSDDFALEGSYDLGNGLTILAGVVDSGDAYYAAGTFDLGGGAELLVSYAEDENNPTNDEIGDPEYMHGTTVEVSFDF